MHPMHNGPLPTDLVMGQIVPHTQFAGQKLSLVKNANSFALRVMQPRKTKVGWLRAEK